MTFKNALKEKKIKKINDMTIFHEIQIISQK